jgi:radical SAM protein with 4Fe4S-binding SPASM domain
MIDLKLTKTQIHPTHYCNLKCLFCDVPIRCAGKIDLSEEKWTSLIKELCELRPQIVTISGGGEPLLRTNLLIQIMKILHSHDIDIELITNGTLVSDEVAKTIAECCNDYRVSLHATSMKMDEFLRGVKGSINLSFSGIKKIIRWKNKMKNENLKIDIVMVITKFNLGEIERMIKKASTLGANKVSLRIVHKWGEKYRPSQKQMKVLNKNLKNYESLAVKNNLELFYDFLIEDVLSKNEKLNTNQTFCMLPFREMVIFADGRVAPCCNFIIDPEDSVAVDSVREKTLSEVWFGEKFNRLREYMIKRNKIELPKTCKECSIDLQPINQRYRVLGSAGA